MMLDRLGLVVHSGKARAVQTAAGIADWAAGRGLQTVQLDVWSDAAERRHARDEAVAAGPLDLIVTVGGDGTFLRGMRVAATVDVPVLGIDIGRVGFLTDIPADRAIEAIQKFESDRARMEHRLTLTMRASRPLQIPDDSDALLHFGRGPALPAPPVHASSPADVGWGVGLDVTALNDVVFAKSSAVTGRPASRSTSAAAGSPPTQPTPSSSPPRPTRPPTPSPRVVPSSPRVRRFS